MLKKLITTAAVTLGIAILAACSGEEPASETNTNRDEPRREAPVAPPASTTAPEPTRPQRLDQLLTPAVTPGAARTATKVEPGTSTEQPEKRNGTAPGNVMAPTLPIAMPGLSTKEAPTIAELVPDDPETNDRVLLQDIYAQIDLEQFALDPNEPIPAAESGQYEHTRRDRELLSKMDYEETRDHPYLHLFPHLKNAIENEEHEGQTHRDFRHKNKNIIVNEDHEGEIHYHPAMEAGDSYHLSTYESKDRLRKIPSDTRSHLLYFIYNPWFDPVLEEFHREDRPRIKYANAERITPYWFGNNSTRGVLVETVAALLEEAKLPTVEPATIPGIPDKEDAPTDYRGDLIEGSLIEREWTLEESIRMPLPTTTGHSSAPYIQWEILHPQLPILKITAHAGQKLPLKPTEGDINRGGTAYSVSFVMSLQNRWTSFDEPDRRIIRFQENLQTAYSYMPGSETIHAAPSKKDGFLPPHVLDPDLPYPNYWDDTDYMQHRIIGPVVLTVHKSTVLQPGTYSRVPRTTHWEAPGYIPTDKQAQTGRWGGYLKFNPETRRLEWVDPETGEKKRHLEATRPGLPYIPHRYYYGTGYKNPNVGFPLPGHVMTTSATGPGTDIWREYKMEDWEEYDSSLGEP